MNEILTIDEIERRFPDQWIFVINPVLGPDNKVRSGVIAAHDRDRKIVYRVAHSLKPKLSAVWFNGNPFPAGMATLL